MKSAEDKEIVIGVSAPRPGNALPGLNPKGL